MMLTTTPLDATLAYESPRLNPRVAPAISGIINTSAVIVFLALLAQAFFRHGIAGWSVGLVYIFYDTCLLLFTAWQMRRMFRPTPHIPTAQRPTLGVIIAAHNEERALPVTIDGLFNQSDPPDLIVIADDGSSDGTAAMLERRYGLVTAVRKLTAGAPDLLWLPVQHGGKARALNYAITHVDTEIVLTVDADTLIEEHAIGAMRTAFANEPALVAATGVLTPVCGKSPSGRFFEWFQRYEYIRNFVSRYAWMQLNALLLISGAFAAFRRDALITVGGFDPECLVEDYELIHRLHRHSTDHDLGWTVRVVGGAQARTDAPETLPAFLRQRRRWFAGFLQTQRWNRDMTGNRRFGWLGSAMMPVKALDTLQPIYGLTAFAILIGAIALGQLRVALPIILIMLGKVCIDLTFHLWSLGMYRRWTGDARHVNYPKAMLAALIEPFSFQLMRHAGAAWGWWTFLTGRQSWGKTSRGGIVAQGAAPSVR
jgi:cellulose synthase/poly-beta-1,6-N-acetylglucosamine synthase-like glycosyltransferase